MMEWSDEDTAWRYTGGDGSGCEVEGDLMDENSGAE